MRTVRRRTTGREAEVHETESLLQEAGRAARILVLHGEPGIGKTTVLETALRSLERRGALPALLTPSPGRAPVLDTLADAVCGLLATEPDSSGHAAAVRHAQTVSHRQGAPRLLQEVRDAVRHLASRRPVAMVLDDAHLVADGDIGTLRALVREVRSDGVPVLVAGRMPAHLPGPVRALAEIADRAIGLARLDPARTRTLLGAFLGRSAEPELATSVQLALGTLAGNPGAALSVVGTLREQGRLRTVDGSVCLVDPAAPLRLALGPDATAWFPWLRSPQQADGTPDFALPLAVLLARLTADGELRVDDLCVLASALGRPVDTVGRTLDLLVEQGVVAVDDRQFLGFCVPALAVSLRDVPTSYDIASLRARLVRGAVERAGGTAGWIDPRLCDIALAAGPALPADVLNRVLIAAARPGATGDARRTIRACVAALRRLPHDDDRVPGLLTTAVDLMLGQGDMRGLLELGDRLLPDVDGDRPQDALLLATLAPAWAFAALHEQSSDVGPGAARPAPSAALLALAGRLSGSAAVPTPDGAGPPAPRAAAADSADATAAQAPTSPGNRLVACATGAGAERDAPLRQVRSLRPVSRPRPVADPDALREAMTFEDPVGACGTRPAGRSAGPEGRPTDWYREMVREYRSGSWQTALSLARRIEVRPQPDGRDPARDLSRSLATEICRWTGEFERAAEWMDRIPASAEHGSLVSWARCGLLHDSGDPDRAWEEGWRDYRRLAERGRLAGLERLLLRLVTYAAEDGRPAAAHRALGELDALHRVVGTRSTRESALLARGGVHSSIGPGMAAYALISQRGDQYLLFRTCEWLARLTPTPEFWLQRAKDIADWMASRRAHQQVTETAHLLGRTLTRTRAENPSLTSLELQVVDMVSGGATNRQIATALARSEKSVETYLSKIYERTGCRSRLALATARLDGSLARLVREHPRAGGPHRPQQFAPGALRTGGDGRPHSPCR